jgi:hypothetical protein
LTKRRVLIAFIMVVLLLFGATARLFIWPAQGMPPKVDAIVELAAQDDPLGAALRHCPRPVPGVELVCFYPSPATTQGEAEFAARLAARRHWSSLVLVTTTPQATRARLRLERCFPGHIYVVTSPIPLGGWPHEIAYEWGALLKALLFQRAC